MASVLFAHHPGYEELGPLIAEAARYLGSSGHSTAILTDGVQAIERVASAPPDVLVLTLFVPPRDAFQVVQALRQHPAGRDTRAILITTLSEYGEPGRYWPLLFHNYLWKVADAWQMILAVEQLLHLSVEGVTDLQAGVEHTPEPGGCRPDSPPRGHR